MATLSCTDSQLDAYRYLTQALSSSGWQGTTSTVGTTTATLTAWQEHVMAQQQQQAYYQMSIPSPTWWTGAMRKIKFWRVNQVVEMDEGATYQDPLDELRVKVARWLKPKEACNYA